MEDTAVHSHQELPIGICQSPLDSTGHVWLYKAAWDSTEGKGGRHRGLLSRYEEATHIWSVYSGPVTRTSAVAAFWFWCRCREFIKKTAQDSIQSEENIALNQPGSWSCLVPSTVFFFAFFIPLFLDLHLHLRRVLLNKFPLSNQGTYSPPLIVHNITAHHVATSLMLTLILQVAKETANSEVTVPVSLSELQNLSGRRPSSLSSVLVSHPLDHTILLKLILLPDTGFTYLPSASLWPGTEQNLCILSILRHQTN